MHPLNFSSISFKKTFIPFLFICLGSGLAAQNTDAGLNSLVIKSMVDSLGNQLVRFYVSKDAAQKMNAFIHKRYDEGVYNRIDDPYVLAGMLTSDINAVQRDEHFHVEYNPALAAEVSGNIEDVPRMVAQKLAQEKARNYGFKRVEILNGNIGYLEVSGFSRLNKYSKAAADAAFRFLSGGRALIIDLRYGVGGSPDMVNYIAGKFFKSKTHIADIYIRSENSTLPYWTSPDTSFAAFHKMPVYILTSYKTFSAAEGLAFALQKLKRATLVGEQTRGGAHTVTYKPIGAGFVCDIPFGNVMDPYTKGNWEGSGVAPDILSTAPAALETAQNEIFKSTLGATTDRDEDAALRWQQRIMYSIHHPALADTLVLRALTGVYGANTITYNGGTLYFQKAGMARFAMIAMGDNYYRPLGNDSFIIGFGPKARLGGDDLVVYYDDGRTEGCRKKAKP